jgi:ParB/RepB/Spo0J family partition protein
MERIPLSLIEFLRDADGTLVNPRGPIRDTTDLQFSMTLLGQKDPIKGFWRDGKFWVIDGHRRVTAARALGWTHIDADVETAPATASDLIVRMLAADVREKLSPLARARSYRKLLEDVDWSIERLAKACGVKVDEIELHIAILSAPESVQRRIESGEMSLSAFKALRDQPVAVQEKAAALPKPSVGNVRQVVKEAKQERQEAADKAQPHISSTLAVVAAQQPLSTEFAAVARRVIAGWDTLTELEQARVLMLAESILDLQGNAERAA